jgi:hypothetical protein
MHNLITASIAGPLAELATGESLLKPMLTQLSWKPF